MRNKTNTIATVMNDGFSISRVSPYKVTHEAVLAKNRQWVTTLPITCVYGAVLNSRNICYTNATSKNCKI